MSAMDRREGTGLYQSSSFGLSGIPMRPLPVRLGFGLLLLNYSKLPFVLFTSSWSIVCFSYEKVLCICF